MAKSSMMVPCPASPNITAKRKGKVAIVYTAGFTCRWKDGGGLLGGVADVLVDVLPPCKS